MGTIVNGQHVGVQSDEIAAALNPGENSIVFGSAEGPYNFVLSIERV